MSFNRTAAEVHQTAVDKGFWEQGGHASLIEQIALMHSELSEAVEEVRNGEPALYWKQAKPEGWGVELVDCLIRILNTMAAYELDIDMILLQKMEYNKTRDYRHGGKKL